MRLESAVCSSRSGLDSHGKAISVVGDNVANANTIGYKGSRTEFADLMPLGEVAGGTSGIPETGSGVMVQRVRQLYEAGYLEETGRALDVSVDGNGFFLVGDPASPFLTRAGNFQVSGEGYLVNGDNKQVLGYTGGGTTLAPIDMVHANQTSTPTTTMQLGGNVDCTAAETAVPASPSTFSEIQQAASYSANVDVYDSLGASHGVALYFFKTGTNEWTVQGYVDAGEMGGEAGTPKLLGQTQIKFDTSGIISGAASMNLQGTFTGAAPSNIAVDLAQMKQMATNSQISNVTRNGQPAGVIERYEIMDNGEILAYLEGGASVVLGVIQVADVWNEDGLVRAGSTLFKETENSGTRTVGQPGTSGLGSLREGSLEQSSVDISEEFVSLTVLQRGYQANSQILNAANQLLRDTISLMR